MKGRGVLNRLVFLIIVISLATSAAALNISLSPLTIYETKTAWFEVNVDNYGSEEALTELDVDLDTLTASEMIDYAGWTVDLAELAWSEGFLGTNVKLAIFEFEASAPKVEENTTITVSINGFDFEVFIENDDTPPTLDVNDLSVIKMGTEDFQINANVSDPETGIANVNLSHNNCSEEQEFTIILSNEADLYTATMDLSKYSNEEQICFSFSAENNGGAFTETTTTATIDGMAPTVLLESPADGALVGSEASFSFVATDNLATEMECDFLVDDVVVHSLTAADSETASGPAELMQEGTHTWKVTCKDSVDWQGTSDTRNYTLDKTPPVIRLTSHQNESIVGEGTELEFSVSDNTQVSEVYYLYEDEQITVDASFSIVLSFSEGSHEIEVHATDSVGNKRVLVFTLTADLTEPVVTLLSPENGSTEDLIVEYRFEVEDNNDEELICDLIIDDEVVDSVEVEEEGLFEYEGEDGNHLWYVECEDDAGNDGESEKRNIILEKSVEETSSSSGGGCSISWECGSWRSCEDGEKTRTCREVGCLGNGERTEIRKCQNTVEVEEKQEEILIPENKPERKYFDEVVQEENEVPETRGIGSASRVLNVEDLNIKNTIIVMLLVVSMIGGIAKIGWSRRPSPSKKKGDWDNYLERLK